jgi:hypothetical protein
MTITADSLLITADSALVTADGADLSQPGGPGPGTPPPSPGPVITDVLPDQIEPQINLIATEYRESAKLIAFARTILEQIDEVARNVHAIPFYFDLDTAVGDQLTIIGKQLGWPRCHCVCSIAPVFGFACGPNPLGIPIVGFCQGGTWINCNETGSSELCLNDDEVYRAYLKARRYQMLGLYDLASLQTALRHVWGDQAFVANAAFGHVVLSPGRDLLTQELPELPLAIRVMPVAPGIKALVHLGSAPLFGFGTGWAGLCEGGEWLCPIDPHAYDCAA